MSTTIFGKKLDLPWIIKSYSRDNALAIGLDDRGLIKEGMKADINIIDFDNLTLYSPEIRYDLPAGGKRLVQRVDGYKYTIDTIHDLVKMNFILKNYDPYNIKSVVNLNENYEKLN